MYRHHISLFYDIILKRSFLKPCSFQCYNASKLRNVHLNIIYVVHIFIKGNIDIRYFVEIKILVIDENGSPSTVLKCKTLHNDLKYS